MTRILVLDSGLHQREVFHNYTVHFCAVSKVRPLDLLRADVVIVTYHVDQIALARLRKAFQNFVNKAGVLVLLGITQYTKWLPYGDWNPKYPTVCSITERFKDDPLFVGLTSEKLKYHATYGSHGFLLLRHQQTAQILVQAENSRVVMYRWKLPKGGLLLATTLDPDHHAAIGTPGPGDKNKREDADVQRDAAVLLGNIVEWSMRESENLPQYPRRLALVKGKLFDLILIILLFGAPPIIGYALAQTVFSPDLANRGQLATTLGATAIVVGLVRYWDFVKSFIQAPGRWRRITACLHLFVV